MCGIVSIFSRTGIVTRQQLTKSISVLDHRGPDGDGIWISPNQRVGLGHKRLSIIDLKTGAQPISNEDESLHIIANGEFYDFENIRTDLKKTGCRFKTKSDSEIALHLYDQYGAHCLEKLRGEFAFIIWDEKNKQLFAARDRFGVKPLYFSVHHNTVYFASEIKALLAAGVPAAWDDEAFMQFTHLLVPFAGRTFFKDIFQVPPGHFVIVTENQIKTVCYWDFNFPRENTIAVQNEQDCIENFKEQLNESVKLRLRADVPVGCYLSDGIDSSSMLAMAKPHLSQPIKLFTLAFEQQEYDESIIAKEMAKQVNSEINYVPVKQADLADNFCDAVWHAEAPFINTHVVAKYLLSRAVRKEKIKAVITGEGADEICAGYLPFHKDMLKYGRQDLSDKAITKLLHELDGSNTLASGVFTALGKADTLTRVQRLLGFVPSYFESFSSTARKFRELLSLDTASLYRNVDFYERFINQLPIEDQINGRHVLNQSLYFWNKSLLPNYNLCFLGDRMEMANSVEGRVPFLDHHLVEAVNAMPVNLKINGNTGKHILREAMHPYLPPIISQNDKITLETPFNAIINNKKSYTFMQDILRGLQLKSLPFINEKKVIEQLDNIHEKDEIARSAIETVITSLTSLCVLQEKFQL